VLLPDLLYGIRVPSLLVELREDSAIQRHANGVILLDKVIEDALHEAVGAQRRFNVASAAMLGVQFYGSEILDVFRVKEHVADY